MARVVFFSERLQTPGDQISAFAFDIIRGVAASAHQVHALSTYDRAHPHLDLQHPSEQPLDFEILRPFEKWSWFEVPRLIPILMRLRPQIMHFIQPHAEALAGWTNAMSVLPALQPVLGNPRIVSSFFDLNEATLDRQRFVLLHSDTITVASPMQKIMLEKWLKVYGSDTPVVVVPPPLAEENYVVDVNEALRASIRDFVAKPARRNIVLPGDLRDQCQRKVLFSLLRESLTAVSDLQIVFAGSWQGIGQRERHELLAEFAAPEIAARVLFTGKLPDSAERELLNFATVVFAACLAPAGLSLMRVARRALEAEAVLLLSAEQAANDTLPWLHGTNAFIADPTEAGMGLALAQALEAVENRGFAKQHLRQFALSEVIDQPVNIINRIYAQLAEREARH